MPFPDFDPVLVQIGPFAIRWYALAYVAGILIGWRYVVALVSRPALWPRLGRPATPVQIDDLILWITLGVVAGGRLGYVFFYTPGVILEDPLEIIRVWNGGMSFHGGVIGVALAIVFFARANTAERVAARQARAEARAEAEAPAPAVPIDLWRLADLVAAATPIGLFFGRIANFINGELWGRATNLPWGVVFPGAGPLPRHPSQLYEAALEGLVLFAILAWGVWGAKLLDRRGVITGMFLVGYAVFRSLVETVREPDSYLPEFPLGLTMGMMLSTPMLLLGVWLIWRGLSERRPAPAEPRGVEVFAEPADLDPDAAFRIQPERDGPR